MSGPVAELQGASRVYSRPGGVGIRALRGASFRVRAGEFVGVMGPSGSGKTTLLNLLALLDRPTAGRVIFEGRDVSALDERERSRIRGERVGMVFQRFHLLPRRSALANVVFRFRYLPSALAHGEEERAREVLERVGLTDRASHPARLLSAGEMQRVAIARALVVPPALLIADEPTGNLDVDSARAVIELLRAEQRRGLAIVMATHNPEWIPCFDRVVRCEAGEVSG